MPYSFSNEQMNGIVEDTYANIIKECESLTGNSKKWAIKIETLHTYVPSSLKIEKTNDPMWE